MAERRLAFSDAGRSKERTNRSLSRAVRDGESCSRIICLAVAWAEEISKSVMLRPSGGRVSDFAVSGVFICSFETIVRILPDGKSGGNRPASCKQVSYE